ncbi:glutamine amidotransferase [Rhodovulum euryhalinum]|uniref:Putative glutamine amidotransferase n=1 Tax=Rhodovulum euryhalinum TaxID=35805 RepID=A0A4R2KT38_9RHOB|nr:glutamine amidotransferase [Rhodovulum euryhalinum]TCO74219.1 putative glutamine amidotransferase [Rhodovulum euryhalinum]
MTGEVIFAPLLPWAVLWVLVAAAVAFTGLALWRGLSGWWLRGLAAAAILGAIANPSLQTEQRNPLSDIVVLVVDESASQRLSDRPAQIAEAIARIEAEVATLDNTELRIVRLGDGAGNEGTLLMTALAEALAEVPRARLAGAILLTDGQLHDLDRAPALPAPLHALLTGQEDDWDRRLVVRNAPAFAILGEEIRLTLRIEDQGAVPEAMGASTRVTVAIDGGEPQSYTVPLNEDLEVPVILDHAGRNVIQFSVATEEGELTDRNNAAVVQINGVRDRLRVLLVSGEPHPGERTWRNLLKSDSAVDLVHFTILRPPDKHDGVPVTELSLIAFPTRELFIDKIDEFDLIIFDRYKRRGILPMLYFDNVREYVEKGGAVLIAAGPDFASADSIYRSPLADILPAAPTARVIEEGYLPAVTDLGQRHPVTQGLTAEHEGEWGRWFRLIDLEAASGQVVMSGVGERPLLVLDRVGEGRVALMASDHAWLWNRGFEGGGPQLELLRRLAHWMMKEPELEEEALSAQAEGQTMTITRRSLSEQGRSVEITRPDGETETLELEETAPGRFQATWEGPEIGLYRLSDGDLETVIALGPAAPREFEETIASGARLDPAVGATRGGILALHAGLPDIRTVREGRLAAGRGWIGITPRGAYLTADVRITPLAPAWAFLLLAAALSLGAWLREGRR